MALDVTTLKSSLLEVFASNPSDSLTAAEGIANAIDTYIKTATVNVTVATGIPVTTSGGPGLTSGPGTGTGTIS